MPELFGTDIASAVTDAFTGELLPAVLSREVTGEYDPVDDRYEDAEGNPVEPGTQTFTSEGIVPAFSSMSGKAQMIESGLITASEVPIMLLLQPLGTDPKITDKVTIDNITYRITGVIEKDPAGATVTVKGEV